MKLAWHFLGLGFATLLTTQSTALGQTPVISLEAESINGVAIPGGPVQSVNVNPGDVVELIFRARTWSGGGNSIRGYQFGVSYSDFVSGSSGNVLPADFHATTDPTHVCPNQFPVGSTNGNNFFVTPSRTDYLFFGATAFATVSTTGCDYFGAAATLGTPVADSGGRKYLGTIRLKVSNDATGTFTVKPKPNTDGTGSYLSNQNDMEFSSLLEGVTLNAGTPLILLSSLPSNGAIDARQPHPISSTNPLQGWNQVALNFSASAIGLSASSFEVSVVPAGGPVPSIVSVAPNGNSALLTFSAPIPSGKWTRIRHVASDTDTCLGFLPGDVANDRTASPVDILKEIDHLNGVENYQVYQVDIDRSGTANPADILRVIDLLNGADAFLPWVNLSLPVNPCN